MPSLFRLAAGLAVALAIGVRAGPAGEAGGRVNLVQQEGWWSFAPADGAPFFSLGVCCVQPGPTRGADDPENPCYLALKHYPSLDAWAQASVRRLQSWGFTTLGGWSDTPELRPKGNGSLWLTPVLGMGSAAGAPWWDMWDEANIRRMDETARAQIEPLQGNPRVLGYYSDNELGWWNAALWKSTLEQPAASAQRRLLVSLLRETYAGDWGRLAADFEAEHAAGFDELAQGGMLYLRPGGRGILVMREFLGRLADRYYALMREILHRHDPRALYLGDRYQSFFYPEVARAAARHVDAVSSNLNPHWGDGTFLRCYFDSLYALSGKPILVSEFYAAARENGSGNRNDYGVYPVAPTQAERAAVARRALEGFARLPQVVGADWFQFADEPAHGRADGENFNFGLVDIQDRPYERLVASLSSVDPRRFRSGAPARPDASQGVPRAPADPFAHFKPPEALRDWDRERGFVKPATAAPLCDLYVCWSPTALYLGLYSLDIVEAAYYRNAFVPKEDRALWTVRAQGREVVRARIGAGREPLHGEPRIRIENSSGLGNNVSNVAAMEIPASLLGRTRLRSGDTLRLAVSLLTHAGGSRTEWDTELRLR